MPLPTTVQVTASPADDPPVLVPALTHSPQFLAHFTAVVRQPRNVSLRANLADWLDENGDPLWAELIRIQLALAQTTTHPDERLPTVARARELLDRVGHRIRAFGRELARGLEVVHVDIAGGLPGHVFAAPDALISSAEEISTTLPVTAVNLTAWPPKGNRRDKPFADKLFEAVIELAISPAHGVHDQRASAAVLGQIGRLHTLHTLALSGAAITDVGVRHLTGMAALRVLDLSTNRLTDESTHSLCRLTHLKCLDLSYNPITDAGVERLLRLVALEWVNLRGTAITPASGPLLARLPNLKHVFVGDTAVLTPLAQSLGNRARL